MTRDQFLHGDYTAVVSLDGGVLRDTTQWWHLGELKRVSKKSCNWSLSENIVNVLQAAGWNVCSALQNWSHDPWAFSCWPLSHTPVGVASFTVSMGLFTLVICTWCIYIGNFFLPGTLGSHLFTSAIKWWSENPSLKRGGEELFRENSNHTKCDSN